MNSSAVQELEQLLASQTITIVCTLCIICYLIQMVFVLFLNTLIIYVILQEHRLQTNANMLIVCLSFIDLVAAVTNIPLNISACVILLSGRLLSHELTTAFNTLGLSLFMFSLMTLTLIAVERAVALFRPLKYELIVTKKRLFLVHGFQCTLWAVYAVYGTTAGYFIKKKGTSLFSVPPLTMAAYILVNSVLHFRMFMLGRRHRRQIAAQEMAVNPRVQRETRATHTMAMVLGALYFTHLPGLVTLVIHSNKHFGAHDFFVAYAVCAILAFSNGSLNTLIYCIRNREIYSSVKKVLGVENVLRQAELPLR